MSVVGADTGFDITATAAARTRFRDGSSACRPPHICGVSSLLSLGGCFEIYELFLTGYVAPGP